MRLWRSANRNSRFCMVELAVLWVLRKTTSVSLTRGPRGTEGQPKWKDFIFQFQCPPWCSSRLTVLRITKNRKIFFCHIFTKSVVVFLGRSVYVLRLSLQLWVRLSVRMGAGVMGAEPCHFKSEPGSVMRGGRVAVILSPGSGVPMPRAVPPPLP